MATRDDAIRLCEYIENICRGYGYHVALTGGCLYGARAKDDSTQPLDDEVRKDVDLVFYRIRQWENPRREEMLIRFEDELNIQHISNHGWMDKAQLGPIMIDMLFPEYAGSGQYVQGDERTPDAIDEAHNGY